VSAVQTTFGRVDESLNVYVTDNGVERLIGSQPTMTADQALAFYVKRYDDLAASVRLLEQRVKAKADARSVTKSASKLIADLDSPAAIGDVQSLRDRVKAISGDLEVLNKQANEEHEAAVAEALAKRESIAVEAEKIASGDPNKTNYKNASAKMTELFEAWQQLQKSGVKVSKSKADEIWSRFSKARNTFESNKRAYFASQDQLVKSSKNAKADLVAKAEALVAKGAEAFLDYRKLLDSWKALPKVKGKSDDALWSKFKAAGDAIYAAKVEKSAADDVAFSENLKVKLELLEEAEKIDPEKDLNSAKAALKVIQSKWEKAGKVPRESLRPTEDRLRAVEKKVKDVEQEQWRKSDPATIERTNSMKTQLEESIAKLEKELEAAKGSGDSGKVAKAQEALDTKKAWLAVIANS
jgi:hypothetical protein